MDIKNALIALDALAQDTRLKLFRLLVRYGADGLPAGEISRLLKTPHNTLSFHLAQLAQAKLVFAKRQGRHIIYRANIARIQDVAAYLLEHCCEQEQTLPSTCAPKAEKAPRQSKKSSKTVCNPGCC